MAKTKKKKLIYHSAQQTKQLIDATVSKDSISSKEFEQLFAKLDPTDPQSIKIYAQHLAAKQTQTQATDKKSQKKQKTQQLIQLFNSNKSKSLVALLDEFIQSLPQSKTPLFASNKAQAQKNAQNKPKQQSSTKHPKKQKKQQQIQK